MVYVNLPYNSWKNLQTPQSRDDKGCKYNSQRDETFAGFILQLATSLQQISRGQN